MEGEKILYEGWAGEMGVAAWQRGRARRLSAASGRGVTDPL